MTHISAQLFFFCPLSCRWDMGKSSSQFCTAMQVKIRPRWDLSGAPWRWDLLNSTRQRRSTQSARVIRSGTSGPKCHSPFFVSSRLIVLGRNVGGLGTATDKSPYLSQPWSFHAPVRSPRVSGGAVGEGRKCSLHTNIVNEEFLLQPF